MMTYQGKAALGGGKARRQEHFKAPDAQPWRVVFGLTTCQHPKWPVVKKVYVQKALKCAPANLEALNAAYEEAKRELAGVE